MNKHKLVRELVDGYLYIEKRINKLTDKFYSYDSDFVKEKQIINNAITIEDKGLQTQFNALDKALKDCGWQYTPACFINEYVENKLKALELIGWSK